YTAEKPSYQLTANQQSLDVTLRWHNNAGVQINKVFTFFPGKYHFLVSYQINNLSTTPWSGQFYTQLRHRQQPSPGGIFAFHTFTGAAISSPEDHYQKLSYKQLEKGNLNL